MRIYRLSGRAQRRPKESAALLAASTAPAQTEAHGRNFRVADGLGPKTRCRPCLRYCRLYSAQTTVSRPRTTRAALRAAVVSEAGRRHPPGKLPNLRSHACLTPASYDPGIRP